MMPDSWPDAALLVGRVAERSRTEYTRDAAAYLRFCESPEVALEAAQLARWGSHLAQHTAYSPNTINRKLAAVKCLIRAAAAEGIVGAEVAQAFAAVEGCRVSEVVSLQRLQLRAEADYVGVEVCGKGQSRPRQAPLSREAYARIEVWLAARPVHSEYVFTRFDGRGLQSRASAEPMSRTSAWRLVQRYAEQVGLEHVKPHDFRRFVGTELTRQRGIRQAQRALGHQRIETTAQHYVLDELEGGLTDELY
ncbi:tyrosine-type recombinase/integrase [Candidatus Entotheonella palauensis]|uniref:tyrosine-type recombinase/integrase n=1 Tax=Candidatus Entotheonella palauensis TaxID=93172 RepID=UPI000B7F0522|nr:site-specific integrase [Candidatus Entotheonella palauensis]